MAADPYADLVPQAQEDERKRKREAPRDPYSELTPGGTAEDVKRTLPWSIPKALTGLFGLPRDVRDLATAGREKLYGALPDFMQGGVKQLDDAVRMLQPTDIIARNLPGSQDLRKSAEAVTGPWYDPQTRTGKAADTALQTAATMGRNWLTTPGKAAALTGAMTAGTEGAGALTNDDPWARMFGGMVMGAIPTLHNAVRNNQGAVVRDTIGNVTPAQERAAIELQRRGAAEGIPLMGTESLDRGHNLASYILSSQGGGQTLTDFMTQRPGQVDAAVRRGLLTPTQNVGAPSENAARAQKAATGAIKSAEESVSAQSAPFYQRAAADRVPEDRIADLVSRAQGQARADETGILRPAIDEFTKRLTLQREPAPPAALPGKEAPSIYRTIDKAVIEQPQAPILRTIEEAATELHPHGYGSLTPAPYMPIPGAPLPTYVTDIANLDRARKYFRDKGGLPEFAADAIPKEANKSLKRLNAELRDAMEAASPTFAEGRALHQRLTRDTVEPLLAGPVGKVAGKGFDPAVSPPVERVTSAVSNADQVRPQDIRTLYTQLNAQDRQAFPGIAKTWIENELNTALADLRTGPNPSAGSKLRQALYGSPQQRENFDEVMRGVAVANNLPADDVVRGTRNLMELLDRTGRTPGMGSPTATRGEIGGQLRRNLFSDAADIVSTSPAAPFTRRLREWQATSNANELARVLTAPNSVELLVKMAKLRPNGLTMRYYVASMLGLDEAIAAAGGPGPGTP